jgi:hypothetical protein
VFVNVSSFALVVVVVVSFSSIVVVSFLTAQIFNFNLKNLTI